MDVRLSSEQVALRDSAVQIVERLGVGAVAELGDQERVGKLDAAVESAGWRELRTAVDGGAPWGSAVEVAIIAEELGRGLADVAFLGPTMAAELRRLSGAPPAKRPETVALTVDLAGPACAKAGPVEVNAVAVDTRSGNSALVLMDDPVGYALGEVAVSPMARHVDLTRPSGRCTLTGVTRVPGQATTLGPAEIERWQSLGLATTCADLVGTMRGALALACDYARARQQYGVAIGSFQAVQHLLADALVATEGSRSITLHAAWAVDALPSTEALAAAAAAKAYCARAARSVCETAIQVHGGIGNTQDCLAHVFLRRALLSTDVLGGVGANLDRVLAARGVEVDRGLR